MIGCRLECVQRDFHTITSILKHSPHLFFSLICALFPYDYVYFKAWIRETGSIGTKGFPYDYVYFKAPKIPREIPPNILNFHTITSILKHRHRHRFRFNPSKFPYDYVYFKAGAGYLVPSRFQVVFPYDYVYFKASKWFDIMRPDGSISIRLRLF